MTLRNCPFLCFPIRHYPVRSTSLHFRQFLKQNRVQPGLDD
jgi:hypothetical protein